MKSRGRLVAGRGLAGLCVVLGALLLAPSALAAGPATSVMVSLSAPIIAANGSSTTTATATVTDVDGDPVAGETVGFSTDGGQLVSATTDNGDGTYSATVTSTATRGQSTVTATDTSVLPSISGSAPLTQFGPAASLTLALTPPSIVANGASASTATATVHDAEGDPVVGDSVAVTASGGQTVSGPTDNGDGTYAATITSTTRAGASTITATDQSAAGVSDQATLAQTPGRATTVVVSLSPPSIVADGASTTLATATVTDANGNAVAGDHVEISSSTGQLVTAADRGDGTYSAQIHSTTTPGPVTITATDTGADVSGRSQLGQTAGASSTSLRVSPGSPVTNEVVTLIATVSSGSSGAAISGSITFANIGGPIGGSCANESVSSSSPTATCQVSFSADASPTRLTATFTPDANSGVSGSTGTITLPIGADPTSTSLSVSNRAPVVRRRTRYTASVRSRHSGFAEPTGSVEFLDGTKPIAGCARAPLLQSSGPPTAMCSAAYRHPGAHRITARYLGNHDFAASNSSATRVTALGVITSKLRWSFASTRAYTSVVSLVARGAPVGAKIVIVCHGRGCPFATRTVSIKKSSQSRAIDLTAPFRHRRLSRNAQLTITIVRPNWIGTYYGFVVRSGRPPQVKVSCLAPGSTKPGVGCRA